MMLERTLKLVDEDTTVILVSDHGFHSDHLRPKFFIKEPAAPAQEHSPFGVICMRGPGIKKGEKIFGASILDLTPTILALYGLPIGKNMEGKPLVQAFKEPVTVDYIPDWEKVEGDFGTHPTDLQDDPWAAQEAMQQLIELGYIDAPGDDIGQKIEDIKQESKFYVARNLLDAKKTEKAIVILEEIFSITNEVRYGQKLAHAYLMTRKFKKCKELIEQLKIKQVELEKEEKNLTPEERSKKHMGFVRDIELPNYIDYVEGLLLMHLNRPIKALELLRRVEEKSPGSMEVLSNIGKVCLIDEANSSAHHGLGVSMLRRDMVEEALEEFFISVELNYYFPNAHYHIGEALMRINRYEEASQAFETAAALAPGMTKARKWLVEIYDKHIVNEEKSKEHKKFIKEQIKGEIIIVSGLPRSGTSMMMQMLDKGGYEVLTDKLREPDNNNPKGYYEYEPVKKMMVDKSWLPEATGELRINH